MLKSISSTNTTVPLIQKYGEVGHKGRLYHVNIQIIYFKLLSVLHFPHLTCADHLFAMSLFLSGLSNTLL
jgi:hypothetical protein